VLGYFSTSPGTKRDEYGTSLIEQYKPGKMHLWRTFNEMPQQQRDGREGSASRLPTEAELRAAEPASETARALFRMARGGAIGTEEMVRENLKRYEESHLDLMTFGVAGADRKHEHIME